MHMAFKHINLSDDIIRQVEHKNTPIVLGKFFPGSYSTNPSPREYNLFEPEFMHMIRDTSLIPWLCLSFHTSCNVGAT